MSLTFDKYPFLKKLGLSEENQGCYYGEWKASGEWVTSVNPHNNEPIAKIRHATADDYEKC